MLQLFKNYQPYIALFVLLYALLLHSHFMILPTTAQPEIPDGVLGSWVDFYLSKIGGWNNLIALLVIVLQALFLNFQVNRHKMLPTPTFFPAIFYILVLGFLQDKMGLNAILLANTFFIIAIAQIFTLYRENKCADSIFNIGFWIAVGSLCYSPIGVFLLLGVVALMVMRSSNFNDFLILFIGFLIPYFLTWTGFYLFDALPEFYERQFTNNLGITNFLIASNLSIYAKPAIIILTIIGFVASAPLVSAKAGPQGQRSFSLLYWALLISVFTILFQLNITTEHLLILSMPLGVILATLITRIKNPTAAELVHLTLLILVLGYQYRSVLV